MNQKDLKIVSYLRQNARMSLTKMSKKTHIPISTIFDKIKAYENELIKKHTTLIDFSKLGFSTKANVMIKVARDKRQEIKECLLKHSNVNSVYKINNGFDFLFECLFTNIRDLEEFIEKLDERFGLEEKQVYYVIDELKRESFMSNPQILSLFNL